MKYQVLFSLKNEKKEKYFRMMSATVVVGTLKNACSRMHV